MLLRNLFIYFSYLFIYLFIYFLFIYLFIILWALQRLFLPNALDGTIGNISVVEDI